MTTDEQKLRTMKKFNWYEQEHLWKSATFWFITFIYAEGIVDFTLGHGPHRYLAAAELFMVWGYILLQHRQVEGRKALSLPFFVLSLMVVGIATVAAYGQ
jgi:hypothetical protein